MSFLRGGDIDGGHGVVVGFEGIDRLRTWILFSDYVNCPVPVVICQVSGGSGFLDDLSPIKSKKMYNNLGVAG